MTTQSPETVATTPGYSRSAFAGYAYTGVALVVALVSLPILARGLGPERFGIWSVAIAAVSYLEVLELGFGGATVGIITERLARRDEAGLRRAATTSFWLLSVPGVVAFALGVLGAALAPHLITLPAQDVTPARLLIILFAVDLAISIPCDTFGGLIAGFQRLDLVSISLGTVLVAQGVGWIVVLALGGGLVPLGITTVALSLAGQLSRYFLARRLTRRLPLSTRHVERPLIKRMSGVSGWFAVSDLNKLVVQRLDVFLVAAVAGIAPAGIYVAGQKLALLILRISDPLNTALFPHASTLKATGGTDAMLSTLVTAVRVNAAVTIPAATAISFFASPLLKLWVGQQFTSAAVIVVLLGLAGITSAVSNTAQQVLLGIGDIRQAGLISLLESAVNVAGSIALGEIYGARGVAIATLASGLLSMVVMLAVALRATGGQPLAQAWWILRSHLLAAAPACALAVALRVGDPDPGPRVLLEAAAVGLTHLGALAVLGTAPSERTQLRARLARHVPAR